MQKNKGQEKWKEVSFDFRHTGSYRLEVSSLGNLTAHNKFSDGEPLKGSMLGGYRIIRLKFLRPGDRKTAAGLKSMHAALKELQDKVMDLKLRLLQKRTRTAEAKKIKKQIIDTRKKINAMRFDLRKARAADVKQRIIHYHSLVHRLVADYFCTAKTNTHSLVGHLDYNKLNNKASNLRWMTPEENYKHQQSSPNVIKEKKLRATTGTPRSAKLTVDKVQELKKLMNQAKPVKFLVKKFKISDTQILRIRRGVNWGNVVAAE